MWIDKIEVVKWYITGGTASELEIVTPKTAYNNTKGKDPTGDYPAPQATSTAKIGLMYTYELERL